MIVCATNFEIFRQNNNDMTNHRSSVFAKIKFKKKLFNNLKQYFSFIMFKTFRNIIVQKKNEINSSIHILTIIPKL